MTLAKQIDQLAGQCVKCGLCLPHCPTYNLALNENESPRGRIALMQGAVNEQVPITPKLLYHLDTCLSCRACEAVCPAEVKYETLFNSAQVFLAPQKKYLPNKIASEKLIVALLEKPKLRALLKKITRLYYAVPGLSVFFKKLHSYFPRNHFLLLARLPFFKSENRATSPIIEKKGSVLLLQPCASEVLDPKTINDAEFVLTQLGFEVKKMDPSICCGALSLHAGNPQQAEKWENIDSDVMVTLASGCHSVLQNYAKTPIKTIEEFILESLKNTEIKLAAVSEPIVVHIPCTLRNGLKKTQAVFDLLNVIPEINIIPIPTKMGCCGASGTNFLRHSDTANQLVNTIVDFCKAQRADIKPAERLDKKLAGKASKLITSNIGCALHVQAALQKEGIKVEVMHPVSLIAQQLSSQNSIQTK